MEQDLLELCTRLLDARNALKGVLGCKYAESLRVPKALVIAVCERTKKSALEVAMELASMAVKDGKHQVGFLLLASATELMIEEGKLREKHHGN